MKNFSYKRTEITTMKAAGIIDASKMTIEIDGADKSLSNLLWDFHGAFIEINIKIKDEEDLDEPDTEDESRG